MATKLLPLRPSGCALRSMSKKRPSRHTFSTTPATAALSPHSKSSKKIASEPTKRTQATAAAPAPYGCLASFALLKCASILTGGNSGKQDQYRALLSTKTFEGMMCRLYRIVNCQRWMNREFDGLSRGMHVLTIFTASSVSVVERSFTR
jgi:hypothetical protein